LTCGSNFFNFIFIVIFIFLKIRQLVHSQEEFLAHAKLQIKEGEELLEQWDNDLSMVYLPPKREKEKKGNTVLML
jgi:hypothetical protein